MKLVNRDDQAILTVVSQMALDSNETVYNFEVQDFSTYHIGEIGIWVHNARCCDLVPIIVNGKQANVIGTGGNTTLKGTVFNTANKDDIQVGFGLYADANAKVIFDVVQHQITTTHNQERESTVWQKTVEKRDTVTTAQLPKFNQAPTITGPNGNLIDIEIPVNVDISDNNQAKLDIQTSQEELGKIALNLSKQPGYEYLAELDKNNDINWVQVQLIQEHFKFEQEGLTAGAAALIALAVTMATGGAGAAGMGASITGTTGAMGAASTAAFSSLASQAAVTLINNKGDISKTLKDMASSETIRGMATAALTAGVGAQLGLAGSPDFDFSQNLANGIGRGLTNAVADAALNDVSFEEALKNSLRSSLVDVFAAETFGKFVKGFEGDDFASNLTHKLVAAGVGCITASAKKQDCNAGAVGAAVGETMAQYITDDETKLLLDYGLASPEQMLRIENIASLTAGTLALLVNVDVDTAADSAGIAVRNNHNIAPANATEFSDRDIQIFRESMALALPIDEVNAVVNALKKGATTNEIKALMGASAIAYLTKSGKINDLAQFIKNYNKACFVAGTLVETIDGLRAIETIQQGDLVWSRHEDTLEYGYRPVVDTFSFDDKEIYEIVVRDNHGKLETYQTTKEHPFWVVDTGWLPASLLQTGMTLVNRDNQAILTVISQTKLDKTETVYNFEVDEFHTYYIGELGVWVHNACYDKWGINLHVVTVKHHNWNKVFGNKVVTLEDVNPIIKEALEDGAWRSVKVHKNSKGVVTGEGLILETQVKGQIIWVEGFKMPNGTIIAKNAGVK